MAFEFEQYRSYIDRRTKERVTEKTRSSVLREATIVGPSMQKLKNGKKFSINFDVPKVSTLVTDIMKDIGYEENVRMILETYHRTWVTEKVLLAATLSYSKQYYVESFSDDILKEVINEVRREIVPDIKLKSWTANHGKKYMPSSTSAGLPYLEVKSMNKEEAWKQDVINILTTHKTVQFGKRKVYFNDCAALARGQISTKNKNKVRLDWAYSFEMFSMEGKYAHPIIEAMKNQIIGKNIAYGAESSLGGCYWIDEQLEFADIEHQGTTKITLDYSSFDQTVPPWLIKIAFSILLECFDLTKVEGEHGKIINSKPWELLREWEEIINYFINTPIRMPDGRRFMKTGGVPSGSAFSTLINSICNLIALRYSIKVTCGVYPVFDVVFSDNAVIAVPATCYVDMKYLAEVLENKFGLLLNLKNSYCNSRSSEFNFLDYQNVGGQAIRNENELLCELIFPDSTKEDSWEMALERSIDIRIATEGCSAKVMNICQAIIYILQRDLIEQMSCHNELLMFEQKLSNTQIEQKIIEHISDYIQCKLTKQFSIIDQLGLQLDIPRKAESSNNICVSPGLCNKLMQEVNLVKKSQSKIKDSSNSPINVEIN